jgi:DNA-binding response OmpR family regulator
MYRPCFLVVDHEYPGSLSSRKLVLETAKFNVITAYSNLEAIETMRRFAAVDGVVLNAHAGGQLTCAETVTKLRAMGPKIPILVTSAHGYAECGPDTHHVESFDPAKLLERLQDICRERTMELSAREEKLRADLEGDD